MIENALRSEGSFDEITKNERNLKCLVKGKTSKLNDPAIRDEDNRKSRACDLGPFKGHRLTAPSLIHRFSTPNNQRLGAVFFKNAN